MYSEAIEEFKRHLSLPTALWAPERAASMRYLAKMIPLEGEKWLLSAIVQAPGRRESLVELSQLYFTESNWQECLKYAQMALDIVDKPLDFLCEDFAWGHLPWDLAAISSYWLGNSQDSVTYGKMAIELSPKELRLKTNLDYYLGKI